MKRIILLNLAWACCVIFGLNAFAQAPCTIDPSYQSPGIYPSSDSLPDGCINRPYNEIVQFVFPPDTLLFGFTLPFDSFKVISVTNIPTWATWQCDQFQNNCTYYTTPGQLTRGCVAITGIPDSVFNDSVQVEGRAYVTFVGIGTPLPIDQTIRLNLHVYTEATCPYVSISPDQTQLLGFNIAPNPIDQSSRLEFTLVKGANVEVQIIDLYGRKVSTLLNDKLSAGSHQLDLFKYTAPLSSGIYFLHLSINQGTFKTTRKLLIN